MSSNSLLQNLIVVTPRQSATTSIGQIRCIRVHPKGGGIVSRRGGAGRRALEGRPTTTTRIKFSEMVSTVLVWTTKTRFVSRPSKRDHSDAALVSRSFCCCCCRSSSLVSFASHALLMQACCALFLRRERPVRLLGFVCRCWRLCCEIFRRIVRLVVACFRIGIETFVFVQSQKLIVEIQRFCLLCMIEIETFVLVDCDNYNS